MAHVPLASIDPACDSSNQLLLQLKGQEAKQQRELHGSSVHELQPGMQEHQTGDEQTTLPLSASQHASLTVPYVGVDKVPGRSRWPYRAVLSLPASLTGAASPQVLVCENYYRTAEAAARAVDAICMVLLGEAAAINFPRSSYDAADLADAAAFLHCISGGAYHAAGGSCGGCAAKEAAALLLLSGGHQGGAHAGAV